MVSNRMRYTEKQLKQFRNLLELVESSDQMSRIKGRTQMPKFVRDVGKEKCDEMFKVLLGEVEK